MLRCLFSILPVSTALTSFRSLFTKPCLPRVSSPRRCSEGGKGGKVLTRWEVMLQHRSTPLENSFAVWDLLSAISHNRKEMKPQIRAATVSLITLKRFADWVLYIWCCAEFTADRIQEWPFCWTSTQRDDDDGIVIVQECLSPSAYAPQHRAQTP